MKYLSVIQHTQSEWLGHIEDHLEGRGIRFGYHRPFSSGGKLPDIATVGDGLILVGGGPWGAATKSRLLPNLDTEVRLTRACLMLGKPVLGLGLGSQILSLAAEGKVVAAPYSLATGQFRRVRHDALAGRLPERVDYVSCCRDRAEPPAYAEILAVDESGHPAIFQIGTNAFGFASHPGVRPAMIEDLIMEFEEAPPDCGETLASLHALGSKVEDALVHIMTGVVELTGWMAPCTQPPGT